jgi:hypothetical protein
VRPKNKCIQVDKAPGYVDADVVPCFQYRLYTRPDPDLGSDFIEGIIITPADGSARITNYPKEHIQNGKHKNSSASQNYKKTVRQIKRLRNRAVEHGQLGQDEAPGYLLECMVFNVPDYAFHEGDDLQRLQLVSYMLAEKLDVATFTSCDKVHSLFGTDPGGFNALTGRRIAGALWAEI